MECINPGVRQKRNMVTLNRVAGRIALPAPTPPDMREWVMTRMAPSRRKAGPAREGKRRR